MKTKTEQITFKIKINRLNQAWQLIKQLLLHTVKSLITISLFFTFLSLFIFNLQIQSYHFDKDNNQVITSYNDIIQCLDNPIELLHMYLFEN